ncbi:hypothetical protein BASA81_006119 [Batrachochytrium salamandrivorans]|nr:hypothetical protein BASA81_006119 [Batrachochytrium salamandrivorans]
MRHLWLAAMMAAVASAKFLGGMGTHFVVLQSDGQVFAVGSNEFGQLGLNASSAKEVDPKLVPGVSAASHVSAGETHSCVVDGSSVKCTGSNLFHQLGVPPLQSSPAFVPVLVDGAITKVFCGVKTSCALVDERALCWGDNPHGGLGIGSEGDSAQLPTAVVVGDNVKVAEVALGLLHSCWLSVLGNIYCAGLNYDGQLGDGTEQDRLVPTLVSSTQAFTSLSCGGFHCCAVTAIGGEAMCWGSNYFGQLGNPLLAVSLVPVQVATSLVAASVWVGDSSSFVVVVGKSGNNSVLAFGSNAFGQLGNGNKLDQTAPVAAFTIAGPVGEIRGGSETTCVYDQGEENVQCVGTNAFGQMGVGPFVQQSLTLVQMQGMPTRRPTPRPTPPSKAPSPRPTAKPTKPTKRPTFQPSKKATGVPTLMPTLRTVQPTSQPTVQPTTSPASTPSMVLTSMPTVLPTAQPSLSPTVQPSLSPTVQPSLSPTVQPSLSPTVQPSLSPTTHPSVSPSSSPTLSPST